jgi:hypothetical protein
MMHQVHGVQTAEIHDIPAIVERLETDGIVLVPGHLGTRAIAAARSECDELFYRTPTWAHHEEYSVGESVRMERRDVDPGAFPAITSALARPELEAVVHGVFGDSYIFSRTIYAILDIVGSKTRVQELHYDKMRHLKSFVYLTDVGAANGPFHCVPGSHLLAREAERENRRKRIVPSDDDARVVPPEMAACSLPVLGEAGTLILFDSDILHRAGVVTEGKRLAIRSLSFGAYRNETWHRKDGTIQLQGAP